jgi:hypothetical protein
MLVKVEVHRVSGLVIKVKAVKPRAADQGKNQPDGDDD